MKRLLKSYRKIFFILLIIVISSFFYTKAKVAQTSEEVMDAQKSSLNVGEFISQCKKYTSNVFGDTDFNELLSEGIQGKIDNEKLGNSILKLLGKETIGSIRTIRINYHYYCHTFYFKKYE